MAVDLDNLFSFKTSKYVAIRDRRLGMMRYSLMLFIFIYVCIYCIMYKCKHMILADVRGFGRAEISHPTKHDCDPLDKDCVSKFTSLDQLPYCSQSLGAGASEDPGRVLPCRYFDNRALMWQSNTFSTFFVPTKLTRIYESAECDPKRENHYDCDNVYRVDKKRDYFVADIDDYELQFHHSFEANDIDLSGVSHEFQGFFLECGVNSTTPKTCDKIPIVCGESDAGCKDRIGANSMVTDADKENGKRYKTPRSGSHGDIISIREFLKLTKKAQSMDGKNLLNTPWEGQHDHLRATGGAIVLSVHYNNVGKWQWHKALPITYTYRPYFFPSKSFKQTYYVRPPSYPQQRVIEQWHGIYIEMSFEATLSKFSMTGLLTVLTTSLTLILAASTITNYLAIYGMKHKGMYTLQIYQPTHDFSDYDEVLKHQYDDFHTDTDRFFAPKTFSSMYLKDACDKGQDALPADQIMEILLYHDMRLNRTDGMDEAFTFHNDLDEDEKDARWQRIQNGKNRFLKRYTGSAGKGGTEMTPLNRGP